MTMSMTQVELDGGSAGLAGADARKAARQRGTDRSTIWSLLMGAGVLSQHTFDGTQPDAELQAHRLLYSMYSRQLAAPWDPHWQRATDETDRLRRCLEEMWIESERIRLQPQLEDLPSVEGFEAWAVSLCQSHASNVQHPLFAFLRDRATFAQLREFILQETPFDIYFGDIIAMMLPALVDGAKAELATNLWDEMGRGVPARMHRRLRLDMMAALGIAPDAHLAELSRFCVEELRLANAYLHAVTDRSLLLQAIGMLLTTELMVPGRLDQQIQGWRRVGLKDEQMQYLLEHTIVDPIHAHGWMENVVKPLLRARPELMPELVIGMLRRLDYAGAVCDRMQILLPEVTERA
jgi:pyrroloquinoline quinone (PQQ) biosynthesis protein C